ncbi:MAG: M28 family peptidase [Candidatus Neomarinimicrobiota bacterium]
MKNLNEKAQTYLNHLCLTIPERLVGTDGNRAATRFVADEFRALGWEVETPEFDCMYWTNDGADLKVVGHNFPINPGPYSRGFTGQGELVVIRTVDELKNTDIQDKIILLIGEIAREQLMPKNFVFYNPEHHQEIIRLLEAGAPRAILSATGRDPQLAGGVYPFSLIEDGDFDIPNAYMKDVDGEPLTAFAGKTAALTIRATRNKARGCNINALKGDPAKPRIVVTAHIDAKMGTPGAIDNATGVITLLLLAELLKDYPADGNRLELTILNGEDYYSVPGEMLYFAANEGRWSDIRMAINIDGVGYYQGESSFSTYNLTAEQNEFMNNLFAKFPGIKRGAEWYQSDHGMFVQQGCPAMALTSGIFLTDLTVYVTHTPKDHPGIVEVSKVSEIATALAEIIAKL